MVLDDLNPQQREVVLHNDGPLLVVAGAGTGKTQVITRRMAYLIESGKAAPTQLLALTFTEKAAREMAERLYDLIGWRAFQIAVMTFNAFGAELLGSFASHIGRSTRGGLINSTQKSLLILQQLDQLEFEYYGLQADPYGFVEGIVAYIEKLQNAGVSAQGYADYVAKLKAEPGDRHAGDVAEQADLAALYSLYERIKSQTGTFDYYDQLALPLAILRERPNLAQRLSDQYLYVMVDEYQDTSPVQDALLRAFVPRDGNIVAVGDDDQAIYSFRGADIANILGFTDHFKGVTAATLIQNYRSAQPILDSAYHLIRHNDPERLEVKLKLNKQLQAQTEAGSVGFVPYTTAAEEQAAVAEAVAGRLQDNEPADGIAILARSNAVLKQYAKAFRSRGLPFALSTEVNIFEQHELINLWYLLEWLEHRASDEAIAHVVLGPLIGWTAAAYRAVVQRSKSNLGDAETSLRTMALEGHKAAAEVIAQLDSWRAWANELSPSVVVYKLVFETGLSERLQQQARTSNGDRILRVFEDLHLFLTHIQDFEAVAQDSSLAGYIATFPKPPQLEVAEALGDASGVQLLTIHASKGLEFNTVYLVGCTNSAWKLHNQSALAVPEDLQPGLKLPPEHELRRLMYVAATRAKKELIVSAATGSAGGQRQAVSPLVEELCGELSILPPPTSQPKEVDKLMQKLQQFYPLKADLPKARLPFETADGWIELGVSALDAYDRCPHEFYLQYVLGISHPFGPQLAFGTAIHGAIHTYYQRRIQGDSVQLTELIDQLDELWSDRGYASKALAQAAYRQAQKALERFYQREQTANRRVLGSELKTVLEVPEAKLRLTGRIDAYFETPAGIEIRDFKTGAKKDPEKLVADAKKSFQLRTYALAFDRMTGQPPALVTLDYVVTGAEGSAELSSVMLANHKQKLATFAERIRLRDFAPTPASEFHQCAATTYYGNSEEELIDA